MKKVLFVCVENACRSQMREALFNKLAYKVVTMGCGADVCSVLPVETEDWQVEDPSGKSLERFREIREETKRRVERLIEELGFR